MRAINQPMNQSCLHNGAAIKALNTEAQVSFLVSNISYVGVCVLIFKIYFICFWTVLGLGCSVWVFSSYGEWGLLFTVVCGFLTVAASIVTEYRLQSAGA